MYDEDILSGTDELCDSCEHKIECEARQDIEGGWMYSENFALCHENEEATFITEEEFNQQ